MTEFKRGDRVEITLRGVAEDDRWVSVRRIAETEQWRHPIRLMPAVIYPNDITVTAVEPKRKTWRDMPEGQMFRFADGSLGRYWRFGDWVYKAFTNRQAFLPRKDWDDREAILMRIVDAEDGVA